MENGFAQMKGALKMLDGLRDALKVKILRQAHRNLLKDTNKEVKIYLAFNVMDTTKGTTIRHDRKNRDQSNMQIALKKAAYKQIFLESGTGIRFATKRNGETLSKPGYRGRITSGNHAIDSIYRKNTPRIQKKGKEEFRGILLDVVKKNKKSLLRRGKKKLMG